MPVTASDAAPTALADQLCFALYTASRATTSAYRELLDGTGLTYPQYLALLALYDEDGLTVSELGRLLELDSGTLSPLLRRLEAAGRVRRERSTDDGRVVTIHLTESGSSLRPRIAGVQDCLVERIGLDDGEIAMLHTLTQRLAATVVHRSSKEQR